MGKIIIAFLILSLSFSCEKFDPYICTSGSNETTTNLVTKEKALRIHETVCNALNANELIGLQVSIRDSLNENWSVSFGSIDLEQSMDMQNNHILRIGSVTKIFTATLILKLIEQNQLHLDQEISAFFPDIEAIQEVTIRNLLDHSSGIKDVFNIPSIFISASNFPDKRWSPNLLAEVCMEKKLDFTPGTMHAYSNTNFIVLGLIAEKSTGKKIGQLFEEYIIDPLNLSSTYLIPYMDTPLELINGYVHHFALSLKEWYISDPDNTAWSTIGYTAGAMASNSIDLSAFTYHLFNGDLITKESLKIMTGFSNTYGLGIFKINVNDHDYWGHEGEITGFESITAYDPETKIIISICCNTTPFKVNELLNKIDAQL